MLSYQHAYHAGGPADVYKHALLACAMSYMLQKGKPITYMETHAGRGLYDLAGAEAKKTGEASFGVDRLLKRFGADHPYRQTVEAIRQKHGANAYPGSPMIAHHFARPGDRMQLAEMHPQEHEALVSVMPKSSVHVYKEDGPYFAARLSPPTPRRGLIMIDPSYELDHDFTGMADFIAGLHGLWPVGVILLWYPILESSAHEDMVDTLAAQELPKTMRHEVRFPPALKQRGLVGSGMFAVNAPYTLEADAAAISAIIERG